MSIDKIGSIGEASASRAAENIATVQLLRDQKRLLDDLRANASQVQLAADHEAIAVSQQAIAESALPSVVAFL